MRSRKEIETEVRRLQEKIVAPDLGTRYPGLSIDGYFKNERERRDRRIKEIELELLLDIRGTINV